MLCAHRTCRDIEVVGLLVARKTGAPGRSWSAISSSWFPLRQTNWKFLCIRLNRTRVSYRCSRSEALLCLLVGLLELCGSCHLSSDDESSIFFSRRGSPIELLQVLPQKSNRKKSQCAYRHGSSDLAGPPLQGCMQCLSVSTKPLPAPARASMLALIWKQFQLRVPPRQPTSSHPVSW